MFLVVVTRGYSASSPDFSSSRLVRVSAKRDKSVERNDVRRSERISSRASSVDPSARGVSQGGEVLREVVQALVKTLG